MLPFFLVAEGTEGCGDDSSLPVIRLHGAQQQRETRSSSRWAWAAAQPLAVLELLQRISKAALRRSSEAGKAHSRHAHAPVVQAVTLQLLLLLAAPHRCAQLGGGRLGSAPTNCTQHT